MQGHKVLLLFRLLPLAHCGLLGSGTGSGSCAAPPYRSSSVQWAGGCPAGAECCTEYGYCHSRINWKSRDSFRDCNGESNGIPLPSDVIRLELEERAAGRVAADALLLGTDIANSVSRTSSKKHGRFSESTQRVKPKRFENTERFSEQRDLRLHGMGGSSTLSSRHSSRVNSTKQGQTDFRNLVKQKAITSDKSVKTGAFGTPFAHLESNSEMKNFKKKKIHQQLDFDSSTMIKSKGKLSQRGFLESLTRSDWEKFHGKQRPRIGKDSSQSKLLSQTTTNIEGKLKGNNLFNTNLEINEKISPSSFESGKNSKNKFTENGIIKGNERNGSNQSDLISFQQKQNANRINAGQKHSRGFNNFDSNTHSRKNKKTGSIKGNKITIRKSLNQVRNGKSNSRSSHLVLGFQGALTKIHTKDDTSKKINVGPNFGVFNLSQGSNKIDLRQQRENMKNGKSNITERKKKQHSNSKTSRPNTNMGVKGDKNQIRNLKANFRSHKRGQNDDGHLASNTDLDSKHGNRNMKSNKDDFQHFLSSSGSESHSSWSLEKSNIKFPHKGNQRRTGKADSQSFKQNFDSESDQSRRNEKKLMAMQSNIKSDMNRNPIRNSKADFRSFDSSSILESHFSQSNNNGVPALRTNNSKHRENKMKNFLSSSSGSNSFKQVMNKMKDRKTSKSIKLESHLMRSMDKGNRAGAKNTKDSKNPPRHVETTFRGFRSNKAIDKTFEAKQSQKRNGKANIGSRLLENVNTGGRLLENVNTGNKLMERINTGSRLQKNINTGSRLLENVNTGSTLLDNVNTRRGLLENVNTGSTLLDNVNTGRGLLENDNSGFRVKSELRRRIFGSNTGFDSTPIKNQHKGGKTELRNFEEERHSSKPREQQNLTSNTNTQTKTGGKGVSNRKGGFRSFGSDFNIANQFRSKKGEVFLRNNFITNLEHIENRISKSDIEQKNEKQKEKAKAKAFRNPKEIRSKQNLNSNSKLSASKGRSKQRKKDSLAMGPARNQKSTAGLGSTGQEDLQTGFYRCLTPAGEVGREICF